MALKFKDFQQQQNKPKADTTYEKRPESNVISFKSFTESSRNKLPSYIEEAEKLGYPVLSIGKEKEPIKDTWINKLGRFILPRSLEIKLGITEPNIQEQMMEKEEARLSFAREKEFRTLLDQEIKESPTIPSDYKEPTTFIGQAIEGLEAGYIGQMKGGFGYFIEAIGRQIGSPEFIEWGQKVGDKATIELLKRPELLAPDDLKPFFDGGALDGRLWGRTIGQALPYITSTITMAAIGGLLGGPAGAIAGGVVSSYALEKGGAYKRYIDEGMPGDKAATYSSVYGWIAAIIENAVGISPAKIGTKLVTQGAQRTVYNSFLDYAFKEIPRLGYLTLKTGLEEGGEEVIQSTAENFVLKFFKTETPLISKNLADEFAGGFMASIPFGAINIRIPQTGSIDTKQIQQAESIINKTDKFLQEHKTKKSPTVGSMKRTEFPENNYKKELLKEIGSLKELPVIDSTAFDYTPSTLGYNNPYTRVMTNLWNKMAKVWDDKGPVILKEAQTSEISRLFRERQRVYDGLTKMYYEEIVRPQTKLTVTEKQKTGEMIFKRIEIPEDYKPLIKNIDTKIGQLGLAIVNVENEMVANKQLDPSMRLLTEETWGKNLGEYARTLYVQLDEKTGERKIIEKSHITGKGIIDRSAFKRKMTDEDWGANALSHEGKTKEEIETYSTEELKEIGVEAKEKYGWIFQSDYVLARTFKEMTQTYTTLLYQKAIVENPALFSKTEKEGFVKVKDIIGKPLVIETAEGWKSLSQAKRVGPLLNGYIHKGLEQEIKTFLNPKTRDGFHSFLSESLSYWKAWKVAGNPPTVIRNWLSGMLIQTDLAGFPVWTPSNAPKYVKALKSYISRDSFYKKLRNEGQYGSDYYGVEIAEEELQRIIDRAEKSNNVMKSYSETLLGDKFKAIFKDPLQYYGHIDHIQRTYLALCLMEDGATTPQAIHFANKWQLDYRFVPQMIDSLRQGIGGWLYPFLSFYTLMMPRIAEVLVTRPWVLLKYPIAIAAFNAMAISMLGASEEEVENAKPSWLVGKDYVLLLPHRDDAGNFQFVSLDYTFPFGKPETAFIDIDQLMMFAKSPGLMSIFINIANNYDNFTNSKIYEDTDLKEDKRDKIIEYVARNLGPGFITHALNLWRVSQGETTGFPIERVKEMGQTVSRTLGVPIYSGGYNEAYWKIRNLEEEIDNIEYAYGLLLSNPNISDEEKLRKGKLFTDEITRRIEKIQEISTSMPGTQQEPTRTTPKKKIPFGNK